MACFLGWGAMFKVNFQKMACFLGWEAMIKVNFQKMACFLGWGGQNVYPGQESAVLLARKKATANAVAYINM